MEQMPIRVLVCIRHDTVPLIKAAFGYGFDPTFCHSLHEAEMLLDEKFDLILCGVKFDDSRMFEMLELAKAHPLSRGTPFACLKATQSILMGRVFESVKRAAFALGADEFIEFYKWRAELGEQLAFRVLQRHLSDVVLRRNEEYCIF